MFFLQLLSEACGPEMTLKLMLPTILSMAGDNVPNVRFNVAKTILRIGKMLDQGYAVCLDTTYSFLLRCKIENENPSYTVLVQHFSWQ